MSSTCSTDFDTDDEVDPIDPPAAFIPQSNNCESQPNLVVDDQSQQTSRLPLCLLLNARSLYNKTQNFKTMLYQVCPDLAIISETWERKRVKLSNLLEKKQVQIH